MPGARKAKSCTGCRQVKLACDAQVRTPCTRCRDRSLECRFDANFKRVSTRGIVRDVTGELSSIRASTNQVEYHRSNELTAIAAHYSYPTSNDVSPKLEVSQSSSLQPARSSTVSARWLQVEAAPSLANFVTGNFALTWEIAFDLFSHFDKFYASEAYFLEPISSLTNLNERSPLLFWTTALVASQQHPSHACFSDQIFDVQQELLSNTVHSAIQSIEVVHALLLLCLWPVPNTAGHKDPSWNYVSLAISAAQQLFCHRPLPKNSLVAAWPSWGDTRPRDLNILTQSLTWIGCFDVSTQLSTHYGFLPPFLSPQQWGSIDRARENASTEITPTLSAKLEIRQVNAMYQAETNAHEESGVYYTKAIMFDRELDRIKHNHLQHWNSDLEIIVSDVRLHLFAFTFMCTAPVSSASALRASAQHYLILQKALAAASSLVSNMTDLRLSSHPNTADPAGLLTFYPKHYFASLFFAAVFLFRILVSGQAVLLHNRTEMISSLQAAHKIFQSFPQHRDHTRAAINIETLVKILREGRSAGRSRLDTLAIHDRLGASLMWDAVFRAGEERNSHQDTLSPGAVASWKTMTEQFKDRLPPAPVRPAAPASSSLLVPLAADGSIEQADPEWWTSWDAYMQDFGIGFESPPFS